MVFQNSDSTTMHIYFLRHGDASSESQYNDTDRPLIDLGVRKAKLISTFFRRMNIVIDAAFSSPLKRSLETASIVFSNINNVPISSCDFLLNGSDPQKLFDQINKFGVSSGTFSRARTISI